MQRRLTTRQKLFVVLRAAAYESPAEIQQAFEAEYGFAPALQTIAAYDAENITGSRDLGSELKTVFEATRAEFHRIIATIPVANLAYRLRVLDKMQRAAFAKANYPLVALLLEQAAKEVGGMYTNLRKHAGPHGEPLPASGTVLILPSNGRDVDRTESRVRDGGRR